MISFEEAKIIAQKEHNGAYFLNSYTEYKDFWTFGLKKKTEILRLSCLSVYGNHQERLNLGIKFFIEKSTKPD